MDNDKKNCPICNFVDGYARSGISRFHMPGHKGRIGSDDIRDGILPYDITEIAGADSLYEADGIIAESEADATALFGTEASFFSVEGSSQCIRAMLALATKWESPTEEAGRSATTAEQTGAAQSSVMPADKMGAAENSVMQADLISTAQKPVVLAARNVHRAFVTAAALLDLNVEWLWPENEKYSLCSCSVSPEQVKRRLAECMNRGRDVAAVYLTSPDYLGGMQDIRGISEVCHSVEVPLLVDNAHGAYLHFLEPKLHPIDLGADMCCDSAHKTLPALTGCAYLHIGRRNSGPAEEQQSPGHAHETNTGAEGSPAYENGAGTAGLWRESLHDRWIRNAKMALSVFGSTSPSYILLQSLDRTNRVLSGDFTEKLAECADRVRTVKKQIAALGWELADRHSGYDPKLVEEPLKITINAAAAGCTGRELAAVLRECGVECEYADPEYVVLMPSPYNKDEDYNRLLDALESINKCDSADIMFQPGRNEELTCASQRKSDPKEKCDKYDILEKGTGRGPCAERVMSIRQAMFAESEVVDVTSAQGRVLADAAVSCPPAVPVAVSGELIDKAAVETFLKYNINSVRVVKFPK